VFLTINIEKSAVLSGSGGAVIRSAMGSSDDLEALVPNRLSLGRVAMEKG
jgi:hypothetical protein